MEVGTDKIMTGHIQEQSVKITLLILIMMVSGIRQPTILPIIRRIMTGIAHFQAIRTITSEGSLAIESLNGMDIWVVMMANSNQMVCTFGVHTTLQTKELTIHITRYQGVIDSNI